MLFPTSTGGLYVRNEIFRTGPGAAALNNASGGEIAPSFVQSYYGIFDSDRRGLAAIYVRSPHTCTYTLSLCLLHTTALYAPLPSSTHTHLCGLLSFYSPTLSLFRLFVSPFSPCSSPSTVYVFAAGYLHAPV